MRSVNKVTLVGNMTRDVDLKNTSAGQAVATFGLATNRDWVKEGQKQSLTEYHELVAWARMAEICSQFLRKGDLVYVEGYLKTRSWQTDEGHKAYKTEIVVEDMIRLEKRPFDGAQPVAAPAAPAAVESAPVAPVPPVETTEFVPAEQSFDSPENQFPQQ